MKKYYWIHYILTKTVYKNGDCYKESSDSKVKQVIDKEPLIWQHDFNIEGETMRENINPYQNNLIERYKLSASLINWNPITKLEYLLYKDKINETFR